MLDRLNHPEIQSTTVRFNDRFLVVIPLETWLDWTLPSFQTERLECKTGTKLAKFKNSTAVT